MAIDLQNSQNIATGWPGPPQLSAPNIGEVLKSIFANRQAQQQNVADAIKQYQSQRSDAAYIQAAQNAGVLPQGDYSNMTAAQASNLAQRIQDMTRDTDMDKLHQAMAKYYGAKADEPYAPSRVGVPRVWRQLPNGEWAQFPATQAYKIDQQAQATEDYGRLSAAESQVAAQQARYEKTYGVDTDTGGLRAPGWGADQATKDQFAKDQADYFRLASQGAMIKKNRENFEKWHRMIPPTDSGTDEEDNTPLPQGGAAPAPTVPPQAQASPSPAATPRPNAPPPADSAAGHASTYGTPAAGITPASPGSGQVGDLVVGQSKRPVGGKMYTWWGDPAAGGKGWLPD